MRRRVLGLDLSLTSTGMVVWNRQVLDFANPKTNPKTGQNEHRIDLIVMEVRRLLETQQPVLTVIEEAAFSRGGKGQLTQLAELAGCVKRELFLHEAVFVMRTSTANKLTATGNGKASKPEMLAAGRLVWPECPNDDVADALHLARWGWDAYTQLVEGA